MIKQVFFSFCIALYTPFSLAGSPGGLFLLVRPMDSAKEFKSYVDSYFRNFYGTDNKLSPSCEVTIGKFKEKARSQVDVYYLKRKPEGIDNELLSNSLNNKSAKRLKKLTANYKDEVIEGVDAIIFYELVEHKIHFYGLSAINKSLHFEKSTLPVDQIQNEEKLGVALCQAIARLPLPAP